MADLPPLDTLRVFDVAARLGHFQQAADELALTPSAVSHRIRALEDFLQLKLFRRAGRGVTLTDEGRRYAARVHAALDELRQATRALVRDKRPLTMSLAPAIAMRWILPRLAAFQERHPDIELRFSSTNHVVDFERRETGEGGDEDLAIRFGRGDWPGVETERLFPVDTLPVCSPELVAGARGGRPPLNEPADLTGHRLLHLRTRPDDWRMWLLVAGVEGVAPDAGSQFDNMPEMLEAAIAGLGVAMADRQVLNRDLEDGRLVVPFDIHMPSRGAYYLVYPARTATDARFQVFRDWLRREAAAERAQFDDPAGPAPREG